MSLLRHKSSRFQIFNSAGKFEQCRPISARYPHSIHYAYESWFFSQHCCDISYRKYLYDFLLIYRSVVRVDIISQYNLTREWCAIFRMKLLRNQVNLHKKLTRLACFLEHHVLSCTSFLSIHVFRGIMHETSRNYFYTLKCSFRSINRNTFSRASVHYEITSVFTIGLDARCE